MDLKLDDALKLVKKKLKEGSPEEAKRLYQDILRKFPANKKAKIGLKALLGSPTGKDQKVLDPPQDKQQILINLYNQGQLQQALDQAKSLLDQFPNSILLHNICGAVHAAFKRYDAAIDSFKQALKFKPDYAEAHNNMGNALRDKGELNAAIDSLKQALKFKPHYAEAHSNMGAALQERGELDAAIDSFKQALKFKPHYAEAHSNMGSALLQKGELDAAIDSIKQALKFKPHYADAHYNMGNGLQKKDELNAAIKSFKQALKFKPDYAEAHNNMGNALRDKGDLNTAINSYRQALKIKPHYSEAHNNMGSALLQKGELDTAIDRYRQAIKFKPDYAEAHNNMGAALQQKGELDTAIESFKQALKIKPHYADAHYNMGNVLQKKGELNAAIDSYKQALKLKPDYYEAHNNMGAVLQKKGELGTAIDSYRHAIKFKPDYAEAYYNMGFTLQERGELDAAIDSYSQVLKIKPDYLLACVQKLHQQAHICDWTASREDHEYIPELGILTQHVEPFPLLALEDAPERHRLRSELYAKHKFKQSLIPLPIAPVQKTKRLRIGYFSADFKKHPVAYLIAKVIEIHDRDFFEVYGYSIGPVKDDEMRRRLIKGFDVFKDVQDKNDQDIAQLAREDKIDIAIDLTGYTHNSRSGIFAYRAAPIQINHLGYPSTMGTDFIDYIVADAIIIPENQKENYSENIIYLPDCYMPQDNTRTISNKGFSRKDFGLPQNGFVFCCFNNSYKITSKEFDIWMRLLSDVEGSVLWLLKANKWSESNLKTEASNRGIEPNRLIFADKLPIDEHLARHQLADLFLDTFNFNAHTTASDALWAGLPVVTKMGNGFAARVAASLITSIELPELITTSEEEYEVLALSLAIDPQKLTMIKNKLLIKRKSAPLFDTETYTKNLETAYTNIYQRYADGLPPVEFKV